MRRDRDLKAMGLDQLYGVRSCLEQSADPCAPVALRMVEYEMRLRRRLIRERASIVTIPARAACR